MAIASAPETAPLQDSVPPELAQDVPSAPQNPVPQLTPRAVIWGAVLGCLLGVSNLYLGLVAGAAVSVGATAALIALPLQRLLARLAPGLLGRQFSLPEGCVLQTTASGAGYATVSSLPSMAVAWMLLQGHPAGRGTLLTWTLCTSLLGIFFGLALQRRLLADGRLAFPSSVGTAAALRAVHSGQGSAPQVRALIGAASAVALVATLRDKLRWSVLEQWVPPCSMLMVGAGALMGPRVALSMLLGAGVCYQVLVPALAAEPGAPLSPTAWVGTLLLVGAALIRLLSYGLSLLRSRLARSGQQEVSPPEGTRELVPRAWFWGGLLVLSGASVWQAWQGFGIPWPQGVLAVGVSLALTALVCRVLAETGSPPDTAVNQMACGLLVRGGPSANLVHSSLSFNSSAVGADVLANLKTAQLLGAGLRQQLIAQLLGCIVGVLVLVPTFCLLLPDTSGLVEFGGQFPAPSGVQARVLAEMLGTGSWELSPIARWSVLLALVGGAALALAEALLPERLARFLPSPLGMGLAFLLPPYFSLYACVGGVLGWAVARRRPEAAEQWVLPAACGLLSVESLVLAGGAMLTTWLTP
ncbi:OPT/YSL family transporter [Hyalangium versicolor]|uniref:OPT/YSL family transporter n=1 Tax=Hyalangium versicolor TaxID=2861190 RepID=UPI001CCDB188|nr:OPT/YSL family transporter [Hyalangium versicolor]